MGRGFTEYEVTTSGHREIVVFSAYLNYRLADGSQLPVQQQAAWCPGCNHFILAEYISSIEELEKAREELRSGDAKRLQVHSFFGRSVEEEERELHRRIEWRLGRAGPPRCLHCGSTDIRPLPRGEEFSHPATGEKVVVIGWGFADMEWWVAEFNPEGDSLTE